MATPPKREKFAAPPPRRGGGTAKTTPPARNVAPANPAAPSSVPHRGQPAVPASAQAPVSTGTAGVKEMQQAILNFAAVAASTDVTSMTGNQFGKQTGDQSRAIPALHKSYQGDVADATQEEVKDLRDFNNSQKKKFEETKNDKEYLGGSDPFGDFIVQQYVATDPAGSQYLNVDVAGKKERGDASIESSNLRGLIDTISRVGTPGVNQGEKSVDGVWAYRTDHALQGIQILTSAMLNFARDLKIPTAYSEKDLANFKAETPKSYTELKDPVAKDKIARALAKYITGATNFFKELKTAVLTNREHRQYIDQKKPFVQYKKVDKKSAKEVLSDPKELQMFTANQLMGVPNVGFSGVPQKQNWISLKELSDLESFKGFMRRIGRGKEAENPAEVKKMLDAVSSQLVDGYDPKMGF